MVEKKQEILVFWIIKDSKCEECGDELFRGSLLRLERKKALCLSCADLDHLVFLPRGDAALTRRAGKHSSLRVVVLKFSRVRKRYERQGILVEEEALEKAEQECLADEEARAKQRERAAIRRDKLEERYVLKFAEKIKQRYPSIPSGKENLIAEHACVKYSGRIGRTSDAKAFSEEAIDLAVIAHIRHRHTGYDGLLAAGWDRLEARQEISGDVAEVRENWLRPNS